MAANSPAGATGRAPRRPPLWATLIATSCGAGFMPKAPGHTGTLTAVPLAWALRQGGFLSVLLGVVAITAIGTVASTAFIRATGIDDDQRIVIDEVAGYLVTLSLVDATVTHLVLGFGLFRLFDVWKPAPIRQLDRSVGGGWGVMLDDLVAGIYAALILYAIASLGGSAAIEAWVLGLFGRTA